MKALHIKDILITTLIAVLALTSISAYSYTSRVSALINGQDHMASYVEDNSWHVVTQHDWPSVISLGITIKFPWIHTPDNWATKNVICDTATISSDSPPFQQQVNAEKGVATTNGYSFIFTAIGITTNRSVTPVMYTLRANCKNIQTKKDFYPQITIRVDADALADWDPGRTTGDPYGLIIVTPQEGNTITDRLELKLQATEIKPTWVTVKAQKAGVVNDSGVIGDINLPSGKTVYGSQWEIVFEDSYSWPQDASTMNIRHGLAGPGLYSVQIEGLAPNQYGSTSMGPIVRTFILAGAEEQQTESMKIKPADNTKTLPSADSFGSKKGVSRTAVAPTPQPETSYPEPITDTKPVIQSIKDMSRPMSGPVPKLQPPSFARAPAVAAPVPMTRQHVDTASQKAPVTAEQPGLKRQLALARPEITYPAPNAAFTAPASITAKARLVSGKSYFYGLRQQGQPRDIARNGSGRFANLNAGNYCVYVAYDPAGPASDCIPFSVRIAMKHAPAMQTAPKPILQPAPTITPKQVSPHPIKRSAPGSIVPEE